MLPWSLEGRVSSQLPVSELGARLGLEQRIYKPRILVVGDSCVMDMLQEPAGMVATRLYPAGSVCLVKIPEMTLQVLFNPRQASHDLFCRMPSRCLEVPLTLLND